MKMENTEKGVGQWYDVPLDKFTYDAVQAMMNAKKATVATMGGKKKNARDVTEAEKKGMRRILEGYAALGGNLNFLQAPKTLADEKPAKTPKK